MYKEQYYCLYLKKGEKKKSSCSTISLVYNNISKKNIIILHSQFIVNLIRPVLHWALSGIDAN